MIILERDRRLSQSLLWRPPRAAPERRRGSSSGDPFTAAACSRVVLGWLRDCQRARGAETFPPLDPAQPVYVLELGAASGRFAHRLLTRLVPSHRRSVLRDLAFRYVITSSSLAELEALRAHPSLQAFVASGHLDFACFEPERDRALRLLSSGELVSDRTIEHPLAVLCNHAFDHLPQDAFLIEGGRLHERLVTIAAPGPEPDLADPAWRSRLEISWASRPAPDEPYGDPDFDRILRDYRERLQGAALPFPSAALRRVRGLLALSSGRMLLLAASDGCHHEEALLDARAPEITAHGISMAANHHAVGRYLAGQGAEALHALRRRPGVELTAFVLDRAAGASLEARLAFDQAVEHGTLSDFEALGSALADRREALSLPQILAHLRSSGWDAAVLLDCLPAIMARLKGAGEALEEELRAAIHAVWSHAYPGDDERDLAFHLATLLDEMAYLPEALDYYRHSIRLRGCSAPSAYGMGMCHYRMQRLEAALECMDRALASDPGFAAAVEMRIEIQSTLGRRGLPALEIAGASS